MTRSSSRAQKRPRAPRTMLSSASALPPSLRPAWCDNRMIYYDVDSLLLLPPGLCRWAARGTRKRVTAL